MDFHVVCDYSYFFFFLVKNVSLKVGKKEFVNSGIA